MLFEELSQEEYGDICRNEGEAKGRAEGEAKGRVEKTLEMARKMKLKGADPEFIADVSGLTLEQIEAL